MGLEPLLGINLNSPSDIILGISVIKKKNKILAIRLEVLFINTSTNVPSLYLANIECGDGFVLTSEPVLYMYRGLV